MKMVLGKLSLVFCGMAVLCQPGHAQSTDTTSLADFNHTQSRPLQHSQNTFSESDQTWSQGGKLGLNQSDHSQIQPNHWRSNATQSDHSQHPSNGSRQEDLTQEDLSQNVPGQENHTQEEFGQNDPGQEDLNQGTLDQDDHDPDGHHQFPHNTSELKQPVPRTLDWLANCETLPYHLNLSFHNLSDLPGSLFSASCLNRIKGLNLSYNQLTDLAPEVVNQMSLLQVLDVSNNRLVGLPDRALNGLRYLWKLDLSHNLLDFLPRNALPTGLYYLDASFNRLTRLADGVFQGFHYLQYLDLSHNRLEDLQPGVFEVRMDWLRWVDFSHNQLVAFDGWPYMFSDLVVANLSHNRISCFTNRMNVTVSGERQGGVDLSYNNLTRFHETDLSLYLKDTPVSPMTMVFYLRIHIHDNPFICDCQLHWIVDLLFRHLLAHTNDVYHFLTCSAPATLRGRSLGFLIQHRDLLVCEVEEGCPQGCRCTHIPHHGHLQVLCDPNLHIYTTLPAKLPAHGLVSLNLSRHALRRLEADDCDVRRLKSLDVSHNQLEQISLSFLDRASQLEELDLSHNQLTSLPLALQRLSVYSLHLAGNPLVCSCQLARFGQWVKTTAHNLSLTVSVARPNPINASYTVWDPAETGSDPIRLLSDSNSPGVERYQSDVSGSQPGPHRALPDLLSVNCSLPHGPQRALVDVSDWGLDCHSQHVNVHVLVWSLVLVVGLVVAMVVGYKWRYTLRVLLHYICVQVPVSLSSPTEATGDEELGTCDSESSTKDYDVYISMDEKDDDSVTWVCQWLLPFLGSRGRNSLRVYFPLKHERAGVCTLENRSEIISNSHKFLVVLTRNYSSSGLCRHELDFACCYHQQLCTKNIVIVLKNDGQEDPIPLQQGLFRGLARRNAHAGNDKGNEHNDKGNEHSDNDKSQGAAGGTRVSRVVGEAHNEDGYTGAMVVDVDVHIVPGSGDTRTKGTDGELLHGAQGNCNGDSVDDENGQDGAVSDGQDSPFCVSAALTGRRPRGRAPPCTDHALAMSVMALPATHSSQDGACPHTSSTLTLHLPVHARPSAGRTPAGHSRPVVPEEREADDITGNDDTRVAVIAADARQSTETLGQGRGSSRCLIPPTQWGSRCRKKRSQRRRTERQRVLEEWSGFWDLGQWVALEPLRSFLLQGRYLHLTDRLFRHKLLFELFAKSPAPPQDG